MKDFMSDLQKKSRLWELPGQQHLNTALLPAVFVSSQLDVKVARGHTTSSWLSSITDTVNNGRPVKASEFSTVSMDVVSTDVWSRRVVFANTLARNQSYISVSLLLALRE